MAAKLLAILSPQRQSRLLPVIDEQGYDAEYVIGFQDGVRKLASCKTYDLIVVDAELADGSWRNLILFVQNSGMSCEMVVCSRLENHELWAEAIQCGAYDLIAEPFDRQDVNRILKSALESRYMQRFTRPVSAMPVSA